MNSEKIYQILFPKYKLSEEEINWCKQFESNSTFEPFQTQEVTNASEFIDMIKLNNQHVLDCADTAVRISERLMFKLPYFEDVEYPKHLNHDKIST